MLCLEMMIDLLLRNAWLVPWLAYPVALKADLTELMVVAGSAGFEHCGTIPFLVVPALDLVRPGSIAVRHPVVRCLSCIVRSPAITISRISAMSFVETRKVSEAS